MKQVRRCCPPGPAGAVGQLQEADDHGEAGGGALPGARDHEHPAQGRSLRRHAAEVPRGFPQEQGTSTHSTHSLKAKKR